MIIQIFKANKINMSSRKSSDSGLCNGIDANNFSCRMCILNEIFRDVNLHVKLLVIDIPITEVKVMIYEMFQFSVFRNLVYTGLAGRFKIDYKL